MTFGSKRRPTELDAILARTPKDSERQALRDRLRDLALENMVQQGGKPLRDLDRRGAEVASLVADAEIFVAIEDEQRKLQPALRERLREMRGWRVAGEPFEIDEASRLVRIASLKLGIRSRRHSEEEAIEASRGVHFQELPSIERRAVEILLGRRRAARGNGLEVASRIANQVRKEWIAKVPPVRMKKRRGISASSVIHIAAPILDRLASGETADELSAVHYHPRVKSLVFAALDSAVQLYYGKTSTEHVYKSLTECRRPTHLIVPVSPVTYDYPIGPSLSLRDEYEKYLEWRPHLDRYVGKWIVLVGDKSLEFPWPTEAAAWAAVMTAGVKEPVLVKQIV